MCSCCLPALGMGHMTVTKRVQRVSRCRCMVPQAVEDIHRGDLLLQRCRVQISRVMRSAATSAAVQPSQLLLATSSRTAVSDAALSAGLSFRPQCSSWQLADALY